MLNFNKEIISKAKEAKSVEDLLQLAKENNFDLTEERAKEYFDILSQRNGELVDEELKDVAGGVMPHANDIGPGACGAVKP